MSVMKKKCLNIFLVVIALGASFWPAGAQRLDKWLEAADASLEQEDYYSAFHYYTAALQYDSTLTEAWYKRGRAAFLFNDYTNALFSFDRAMDYDTAIVFPDLAYQLASTYHRQGRYSEAIVYYDAFLANPHDSGQEIVEQARKGLGDAQWASTTQLRQKDLPQAHNLGPGVNSPDADFGGYFLGDTLYYSSYRFSYEKDKHLPQRNLIQLMQLNPGMEEAVLLGGPFNQEDRHTAYSTFSLDRQTMYYCECEYQTVSAIRCDIVRSRRDALGFWGPPQPIRINEQGYTTTQPAIGIHPETGEEILYFASDRPHPDAAGGMDIYYGLVEPDGDVYVAENFQAINSAADDVTPYFHALTRQFFFSSKGYRSFGGFDIFVSHFKEGQWTYPENIGRSANSSYNEYHYSLNAGGDKAVFDSDRPGSRYIDNQTQVCCNDLYLINLDNELMLDVYTYNALDSTPLYGAEVQLDQLDQAALQALNLQPEDLPFPLQAELTKDSLLQNDSPDNHFRFTLNRQHLYGLTADKSGLQPDHQLLDLRGVSPETKVIRQDLYLIPDNLNLQILVFDEADSTELLGARVELLQVVGGIDSLTLFAATQEFSHDFKYPDIQGTFDYGIIITRPGFEGQRINLELNPSLLEDLGSDITIEVYLLRSGFPDFLPLSLYFDNAIPYSANYSPTTDDNFAILCAAYAEEEAQFFEGFAKGLTEEEQFSARIYYETFFSREVRGGLEKLEEFARRLGLYLKLGNSLTVQVRGYASPLANPLYNNMLSLRRIKSIENYLAQYNGGQLKVYLDNGQLSIREVPFGEGRVGLDASDTIKNFLANLGDFGQDGADISSSSNRRVSVYSLLACIERRVEIVEVSTENSQ